MLVHALFISLSVSELLPGNKKAFKLISMWNFHTLFQFRSWNQLKLTCPRDTIRFGLITDLNSKIQNVMWLISLKVYYAAEECIDGITTNADQSYSRANYSEVSPWLALEFLCMSLKRSFTTTTIATWRTPRSEWQIGFQQQDTRCSLEETFWGRSKILNQRTSPTRSGKYVIVQTNKARLSLYGVEVSGPSECNELEVVNSNHTWYLSRAPRAAPVTI